MCVICIYVILYDMWSHNCNYRAAYMHNYEGPSKLPRGTPQINFTISIMSNKDNTIPLPWSKSTVKLFITQFLLYDCRPTFLSYYLYWDVKQFDAIILQSIWGDDRNVTLVGNLTLILLQDQAFISGLTITDLREQMEKFLLTNRR